MYAAMRAELLDIQLEKLALSIRGMQEAYRRVAPTRFDPRAAIRGDMLSGSVAQAGGPMTLPGNRVLRSIVGELPSEMEQVVDSATRGKAGRIFMPPGGAMRTFSPEKIQTLVDGGIATDDAVGAVRGLSNAGKKATNLLTGMHEQFELDAMRRVANRQMSSSRHHSHMHPEVMAKQHNLLRTMTGPGAAEARVADQAIRGGATGEAATLNSILTDKFGPRAAVFYGDQGAPKITKAMRKRLRRLDPNEAADAQRGLVNRFVEDTFGDEYV